jgi:hypothetical protein
MYHRQEWENSCVDDQLISLNVKPLEDSHPLEYLLYSDDLPRRNDGRISDRILKRYQHTEEGGWWCSGVDLLTGELDLWGCFKPRQPRYQYDNGKVIKYEHPPQTPTGVFALRLPLHLWKRIANRYQVEIFESDIDESLPDLGFWRWVLKNPSLPICITEGAKKAGALLTAGYIAIALPGINNGYRTPKDTTGNRIGKSHLIPQLQLLTPGKRTFYLVFDQDSKPQTIQAVNSAIRRMGYLFNQVDCPVKVITWNPELGKGVDDFIATEGEAAFDQIYQNALSLEIWKAQALNRLTYTPDLELNCRYLPPNLPIPETAKLIGIKSPKGTGKTQLLETVVKQAIQEQKWVLLIGHRVQLVQELCRRFGLNYITEVRDCQENNLLGYGLCIDSLHPNSQANFNALDWSNGLVIIDEIEQVLWHGLNSPTCQNYRVSILKSLKILMENIIAGQGKVYVADADLSDVSLEYLLALAGVRAKPFIIYNEWKPNPEDAWQVYNYPDSTPKKLVKDLVNHIQEGGKPFICLSAQKLKSTWGTCSLELYLQKQFPNAKILRIDSESLNDPNHPAYNSITQLNSILSNYDIVLASSSIETGVSIDLKGHFSSVWAIAQGVQPAHSIGQILSRIRDNIPRYLWLASYGFNQVGNGSTSIPNLLTSGQRLTQLNIRLLQQSDFANLDDLDVGFQAESLLCWAKMAVRVNSAMIQYRESILNILKEEGHQIKGKKEKGKGKKEDKNNNQLVETINQIQEQNYLAECEAIANSTELTEPEYNIIKRKLAKTTIQRQKQRHYELKLRYQIPVTSQLVLLDDQGWHYKIRLHYFLTVGRSHLAERDGMVARRLIEEGNGSIFLPDFNRSQLGAIIGMMDILKIPNLLENPERKLTNLDPDLQEIATLALNNRAIIKSVIGIGLAKNSTPIMVIRRFLDKIGFSLKLLGCKTCQKKRIRIYQIELPTDDREQVFQQWLQLDQEKIAGENLEDNPEVFSRSRYFQLSLNMF